MEGRPGQHRARHLAVDVTTCVAYPISWAVHRRNSLHCKSFTAVGKLISLPWRQTDRWPPISPYMPSGRRCSSCLPFAVEIGHSAMGSVKSMIVTTSMTQSLRLVSKSSYYELMSARAICLAAKVTCESPASGHS
jgi:hypothetical protein